MPHSTWGEFAGTFGVTYAFVASGLAVMLTALLGLVLRLHEDHGDDDDVESVDIGYAPEVAMPLTLRSGPVVVEVDYDVDPDRAREFYEVMMQVQQVRKRIGAFDWSLARDKIGRASCRERV